MNFNGFDPFSDQFLDRFVSSFDQSMFEDTSEQISWIVFLKNDKIRSVLLKIFDKANAQSSDDDNFLQILNSIQFEDLSSSIIRQLLIQSAICSLQLYVVDNFLCFIETNDEFKDCLQFVEKLSTNPNINSFNLNIGESKLHSVGKYFFRFQHKLNLSFLLQFEVPFYFVSLVIF